VAAKCCGGRKSVLLAPAHGQINLVFDRLGSGKMSDEAKLS